MSKVWWYTLGAGTLAVVLVAIAYMISPAEARTAFAGNLLLNLGSGFVGTAVGVVLGVWIASALAAKKAETIGPDIVSFVAQLRSEDVLSPESARKCVVCVARVLTDERLVGERAPAPVGEAQMCDVCNLQYHTVVRGGHTMCAHCLLPGSVWQSGATEPVKLGRGRRPGVRSPI